MTARIPSRRILFVGPVFPEPTSSAAGVRTVSLLEDFRSRGDRILFVAASDQNAFASALEAKGIATAKVGPNDPEFDRLVREFAPEVAIFDRFMLEEQFGWRVAEAAPGALRILDTIDLHFVRRARGEALRRATGGKEGASIPDAELARIAGVVDGLETGDAEREIAAILRSDLTLVLSPFELALLRDRLRIDESLLLDLGFSYPAPDFAAWRPFAERKHFATIGNFRHFPNRDATFWLARALWPRMREALAAAGHGDAELHLYGAYPPREVSTLDSPRTGFRVLGPAADAIGTLRDYRVCLAPLRFGAGIKGKIADAWTAGVPVATTPIGAEGMGTPGEPFAGVVAETEAGFARDAAALYGDAARSDGLRDAGGRALGALYSAAENRGRLLARVDALLESPDRLADHRRGNLLGRVLRNEAHGRTKYLARWIEEKNRKAAASPRGESR